MRLTLEQLINSLGRQARFGVPGALTRLVQDKTAPLPTKFKLKRIGKQANAAFQDYDEQRKELLEQFINKEDDGTWTMDANGSVQFQSPAAEKEFGDRHKELIKAEIVLIGDQLHKSDYLPPRKMQDKEIFEDLLDGQDLDDLDWLIPDSFMDDEKPVDAGDKPLVCVVCKQTLQAPVPAPDPQPPTAPNEPSPEPPNIPAPEPQPQPGPLSLVDAIPA